MDQTVDPKDVKTLAAAIHAALRRTRPQNTSSLRALRREYSKQLASAAPELVLALARQLLTLPGRRWVAYELIQDHPAAFACLGKEELEEFGRGIDSWWTVDAFARTLAGPAWQRGQVEDDLIHQWARSRDLWWRRAALVSTVAWNVRSHGGSGDAARTLAVCELLAADPEDMVVKALSWALRALAPHNPHSVRQFLADHQAVLAARVRREVLNKLSTGLKNPKGKTK